MSYKKNSGKYIFYYKDKECTIAHREDGPACECIDGYKAWYINGKRHREDGAAIEDPKNGYKEWYINGKRHREDGPALEYASGKNFYYLNDKSFYEEEYWTIIRFGGFV